jgi:hypothetical protein
VQPEPVRADVRDVDEVVGQIAVDECGQPFRFGRGHRSPTAVVGDRVGDNMESGVVERFDCRDRLFGISPLLVEVTTPRDGWQPTLGGCRRTWEPPRPVPLVAPVLAVGVADHGIGPRRARPSGGELAN